MITNSTTPDNATLLKNILSRLKREKNLNQEEVAEKIHYSREHFSRMKKKDPDELINAIYNAFPDMNASTYADSIKDRIRIARERKGYTQEFMASLIEKNLHGQTYSVRQYQRLENGEFPKYKKEIIELVEDLLHIHIYDDIYDTKSHVSEPMAPYGQNAAELSKALKIIEDQMHFLKKQYEDKIQSIEQRLTIQQANFEKVLVLQEAIVRLLKAQIVVTAKQLAGEDQRALQAELDHVNKAIFSVQV